METHRRSLLKGLGLVPILFSKKLLGQGAIDSYPESERHESFYVGQIKLHPVRLERYLNSNAKRLYNNPVFRTSNQITMGGVRFLAPTFYASKVYEISPVSLMEAALPHEPNIPLNLIKRWALALNRLADEEIWVHGTMLKAYAVPLNTYSLTLRTVLVTYIVIHPMYADDYSGKYLNNKLGMELFAQEGNIGSYNWDDLPKLSR